jgi:hypothetical protein
MSAGAVHPAPKTESPPVPPVVPSAVGEPRRRGRPRKVRDGAPPPPRPRRPSVSVDAKKLGALVLEVLAGTRTVSEASEVLGVSQPRYYQLEARALEGLMKGCEPRTMGRKKTTEWELEKLRKELARARRDGSRTQALLRAAQRVVGVGPSAPKPVAKDGGKPKIVRRRRVSRALRVAQALRKEVTGSMTVEKPAPPGHDVSPSGPARDGVR